MKGKVPFEHRELCKPQKIGTPGQIYIGIKEFVKKSFSFLTFNLYKIIQCSDIGIIISLPFMKLRVVFLNIHHDHEILTIKLIPNQINPIRIPRT